LSDDRDLLSELARVLARLYHTAIDSITSEEERAAMLTQLGLQVPDGPQPDAAAARQTIDRLQAKADTDAEDTAELAELVELLVSSSLALQALFDDVRAANDGTVVATLLASYLELMCAITLRLRQPQGYAIFQALRLVDDQELHFERLPELLSSGDDVLGGRPGSAEEEDLDARTIVLGALALLSLFVPEPLDQTRTRTVLYGIDLDPATDHPNAQQILNRMVTFNLEAHTPEGTEEAELGAGLILTAVLVPPHHGGWGLFLSLGGDFELVVPFGEQLELKIEAKILGGVVSYIGTGSVSSFVEALTSGEAVPPDAAFPEFALERPLEAAQSEVPLRLGGKDATHLELRSYRAGAKLGNREVEALVTLENAALVIARTSLPSLLASVLPSGGIRLEATFTLAWDTERGFHLDGGAGLKATLPLEFAVLGVKLHTVTIELVTKTGESSGLGLLVHGALGLKVGSYLEVEVDRLGFALETESPEDKSGPLLGNHVSPGVLLPTGIGVKFDVFGFEGGGFLLWDQERGEYGGVLQFEARIKSLVLAFTAFGLFTERPDGGSSFVIVLSVQVDPPLRWGPFTLYGIGGIVATNHTIDVEAMRLGLRDGALAKLLFPANPIADGPAILQTLRTVFPVSDRRTLVGPILQVGVTDFITASLALVVVTPAPYLVALLGRLRVAVPHSDKPLVDLHADVFGLFDLETHAVSLDATLAKSRIGWFPVEGDLALRSGHDWFFSAGGFHPHYPAPADAPPLRRLRFDASASALVKFRFELYFAVTANTVQIGGRGELTVTVGSFGVYGFVALDTLLHTRPLPIKFSAQVAATLELRFHGSVLASLHADVLVEGPGPYHVKGRVSMSILFWDISVPFDETWAEFQAQVAAADVDVLGEVRRSLSAPTAWGSVLPDGRALVTLRSVPRSALVVHPLGRLATRQAVVPLGVTVTHVGSARPTAGPTAVYLGTASLTTGIQAEQAPATGQFARGDFFDLTDDERLSTPSYEPFQDGVELASDTIRIDLSRRTDVEYETIVVGAEAPKRRTPLPIVHLAWMLAHGAVGRSGLHDDRVHAGPDQSVGIAPAESLVVDTTTMQLATDVLSSPVTVSLAEAALSAVASRDPDRARRLQVVGAHEAAR
jgi:hypothetical protein